MSKENETLDKHENGNDFIADVSGSSLSEAILIIENLMAYGKIHTVKGVRYAEGSHEEIIDKAERWLWKVRKNYR
jgi:hypothetical protein